MTDDHFREAAQGVLVHDPPNDPGKRINSVWLVIATDANGDEGVVGSNIGGMQMPLIASDERRRDSIIRIAQEAARYTDKTLKLIRLTTRENVQDIEPSEPTP